MSLVRKHPAFDGLPIRLPHTLANAAKAGVRVVRVSRIYTEQRLAAGGRVVLEEKTSRYVAKVLRLRAGDALVLFNGDGSDYAAEIESAAKGALALRVNEKRPAVPESALRITLAQAVARGERMDLCLQKATELGVAAVQPLFTERVEVRLDGERLERRMAHWRGVVIAACEQSGRAVIPDLRSPLRLQEWLAHDPGLARLVLDPLADRSLAGHDFAAGAVAIVVGPEGGLSAAETSALQAAGAQAVRLGPRILRTETAGPAAIAVLQSIVGDFR